VQRLRHPGAGQRRPFVDAAGMAVTTDNQAIQIASPDPSVEYVPVYDPQSAYGQWPYPDYPPVQRLPAGGTGFGTYVVFPILVPYWGWDHWDWRHHRIDVDQRGR